MGRDDGRTPKASTILAALPAPTLRELFEQGRTVRYEPGAVLFREGSASTTVVLIRHGRTKITCLTEDGRETLLAILGPGDVLGELGALDGSPRSATVTTIDEVEALVVPAAAFRGLVERDGKVGLTVLEVVNGRLREADRKRVEFGALAAPTRLALRLLELADRYGETDGDGHRIALPLTQEELAGLVGSSRESVTKALRRFRDEGWIETGRRRVTILDGPALRRFAEDGGA